MTFRTRSNLPGPSDSTRSEGAMAASAQSSRPSSAWRTTLVSKKAFIPMLLFRVPQVALLSVDQGSPSLALSDLRRCLVIGPYLWPGERVLLRPSKKSATMLDAEMLCSLAKRLAFSIKALSMRNLSCSRFISPCFSDVQLKQNRTSRGARFEKGRVWASSTSKGRACPFRVRC